MIEDLSDAPASREPDRLETSNMALSFERNCGTVKIEEKQNGTQRRNPVEMHSTPLSHKISRAGKTTN